MLSDAEGRGIVDERRTETADRVARYQGDLQGEPGYATRTTNCCGYLEGALCFDLPVIPHGLLVLLCLSVVVFLFFLVFFLSSSLPSVCHIPCGGAR